MSRKLVIAALLAAGVAAGAALANRMSPAPVSQPGPQVKLTLSDNSTVAVEPFKIDAKHGLSEAQCGVVIGSQRIETLGSGDTDSYTCGKLVEAGPLPPAAAGARIGLIYEASSSNASFRTAVILVKAADGWKVDAERLGEFDDSDAARSIKALADAIAR